MQRHVVYKHSSHIPWPAECPLHKRTSRIGLGFRMRRHFPLGDLHDRMAVALLCQSQSIIAIVAMHDSRRRCMASADSERSRV